MTQTVNERVPVPIDARLVVVAAPSARTRRLRLPISVPSVHVNSTFYVEVWARDGDGSTRGITGGDLSFSFDNTKVTGGTINHGGIFTNLTSGTLHNTAGTVTDLGGNVAPGDNGEGVSQWVRLGYVSFTASAAGTSNFTASRGSDHFARAFEGGIAQGAVRLGGTSVAIGPGMTTIVLSSFTKRAVYDQTVTFCATVKASASGSGAPTGLVSFLDGSVTLGTGTLRTINGVTRATLSTSSLKLGDNQITAVYAGDAEFNGSTTAKSLSITVTRKKTKADGLRGRRNLNDMALATTLDDGGTASGWRE